MGRLEAGEPRNRSGEGGIRGWAKTREQTPPTGRRKWGLDFPESLSLPSLPKAKGQEVQVAKKLRVQASLERGWGSWDAAPSL